MAGLEPTRTKPQILSLLRLPFRHIGKNDPDSRIWTHINDFEDHCSTKLSYACIKKMPMGGIEPTFLWFSVKYSTIELHQWKKKNDPDSRIWTHINDFGDHCSTKLSYACIKKSLFAFYGNWTRVFALKGQCPNQLDEKWITYVFTPDRNRTDNVTFAIWNFNQLNYRKKPEMGIEPTQNILQTFALPIMLLGNLKMLRIGIEPTSCPLWAGHFTTKLPEETACEGIEPSSRWLTATYSTI